MTLNACRRSRPSLWQSFRSHVDAARRHAHEGRGSVLDGGIESLLAEIEYHPTPTSEVGVVTSAAESRRSGADL